MGSVPLTSTRHELNFGALSPFDFERMCLWLIGRREAYQDVAHVGAAGRDQGLDITASRQVDGRVELVYVQCKRIGSTPRRAMFEAELAKISDAVARGSVARPDVVMFVVSQHLSTGLRSTVRELCREAGFVAEFLGRSELDREVKADLEVLAEFFSAEPQVAWGSAVRGLPFERVAPQHLGPPRQGFVNRAAELKLLERALAGWAPSSKILVLEGSSGVGKSRLAEELAHQQKASYPDGQLLVDFRSLRATPAGSVAEALRSVLLALGCPPKRVPESLPDRVGLYRTLTAHQRLMLVLDHATEAAEVRALLPDAPEALVLVTTSSDMSTLRQHGAVQIPVETLDREHSRLMLHSLVGFEPTTDAETLASETILDYCAGLALALDLCGTRIRDESLNSYGWLAVELAEEETRLERMGQTADSLDVVFGTAYAALPDDLARAYRLLGQSPRLSTVSQAAAALGVDGHVATRIVSALGARHLLELSGVDRPQQQTGSARVHVDMHDLLRLHARKLGLRHQRQEGADLVGRLARYAAARARQIDVAVSPDRLRVDMSWPNDDDGGSALPSRDDVSRGEAVPFGLSSLPPAPGDGAEATRAFETERAFLLAVQAQAHLAGMDAAVCVIADALWPAMYGRGHDREIASVFEPAVAAAERMGDPRALCRLRMLLARGLALRDEHGSALAQAQSAIELAVELADDWLLASGLEVQGLLLLDLSGPDEALRVFEDSRSRFPAEQQRGRAIQDHHIGMCLALLGRQEEAVDAFEKAVATLEGLGDSALLPRTGWRLAQAQLALGNRDGALRTATTAADHAALSGEYRAQGRAMLLLAELSTEPEGRRSRLQAALVAFTAASDDALAALAADRLRRVENPEGADTPPML